MDAETLAKVKTEVAAVADLGGNIAGMFLPGQVAYIALGRALAVLAPQIYQDAVDLFQKKEPTKEEVDALGASIHTLLNPETA